MATKPPKKSGRKKAQKKKAPEATVNPDDMKMATGINPPIVSSAGEETGAKDPSKKDKKIITGKGNLKAGSAKVAGSGSKTTPKSQTSTENANSGQDSSDQTLKPKGLAMDVDVGQASVSKTKGKAQFSGTSGMTARGKKISGEAPPNEPDTGKIEPSEPGQTIEPGFIKGNPKVFPGHISASVSQTLPGIQQSATGTVSNPPDPDGVDAIGNGDSKIEGPKFSVQMGCGMPPGWPRADLVVTSTSDDGASGILNGLVLEAYGKDISSIPDIEALGRGFGLVSLDQVNLLFVVTVDDSAISPHLLTQNLSAALLAIIPVLAPTEIWLPLMGVGAGLSVDESLQATVAALRFVFDKSEYPLAINLSAPPELDEDGYEARVALARLRLQRADVDFNALPWDYFDEPESIAESVIKTPTTVLSDSPSSIDHLNHKPIARAIAKFVKNQETGLPLTLSIDGAWGTGKSSIMGFLREELQNKKVWEKGLFNQNLGLIDFLWLRCNSGIKSVRDSETTRHFETVWVNVWRYGSGVRLKAAITNSIIQELTARYGPSFLYKLGLRRFNRTSVFQNILGSGFASVWVLLTGGLLVLLPMLFESLVTLWVQEIGGFTVITSISLKLFEVIKKETPQTPRSMLTEPDYAALVGPDAEIERDFERIVDVLSDHGRTLAIFVDDLDRCAPKEVGEVIESLNVFFGKTGHECLFILGMHNALVAEALHVHFGEVSNHLEKKDRPQLKEVLPFGQRFLEKIVQFSVRIPEPTPEDIERFVRHLTSGTDSRLETEIIETRVSAANKSDKEREKIQLETEARIQESGLDNAAIDRAVTKDIRNQARIEEADEFKESHPHSVKVFNIVRPLLRSNPRQYKRFFNRLRFNNYLRPTFTPGDEDASTPGDEDASPAAYLLDTAKLVAISLEYPELEFAALSSPIFLDGNTPSF